LLCQASSLSRNDSVLIFSLNTHKKKIAFVLKRIYIMVRARFRCLEILAAQFFYFVSVLLLQNHSLRRTLHWVGLLRIALEQNPQKKTERVVRLK